MPFTLTRPRTLSDDERGAITRFISEHWRRATDGRGSQLSRRAEWERAYEAAAYSNQRQFPWRGASNLTIPLIRIFVDTFIARTLNIIYATRPLYNVEGFRASNRDGIRTWMNLRALNTWKHYRAFNNLLTDGATAGTTLAKTVWHTDSVIHVVANGSDTVTEQRVSVYDDPHTSVIHFDDFYVYPTTARNLDEVDVVFHRMRWTRERFDQLKSAGASLVSQITDEEFDRALESLDDGARIDAANSAGTLDNEYRETHVVEVHFRWTLAGQRYKMVALWLPAIDKLADLYYCPYHPNISIFHHYTPWPRKHNFYGYAAPELAGGLQEEVSSIHNDRRNNSMLANSVQYKRRNGAGVPNPTSEAYPGKVWDLEDMDDLDVMQVGRNLSGDMIPEEEYTFSLAERLFGIGPVMQGMAQGGKDKRGVYNTMGTLGVMAESNQRQDTNIRDAREVLGSIGRSCYLLCRQYKQEGGIINLDDLPISERVAVISSFGTPSENLRFEVNTSNAGANAEVNKASLYQLAQVMGQYGTTVQQMSMHLANPQLNPILRRVLTELVQMYRWIAQRLLNAHNEFEAEEFLPDVIAAVTQFLGPQAGPQGGSPGSTGEPLDGQPAIGPASADVNASLESILRSSGGAGAPQLGDAAESY